MKLSWSWHASIPPFQKTALYEIRPRVRKTRFSHTKMDFFCSAPIGPNLEFHLRAAGVLNKGSAHKKKNERKKAFFKKTDLEIFSFFYFFRKMVKSFFWLPGWDGSGRGLGPGLGHDPRGVGRVGSQGGEFGHDP